MARKIIIDTDPGVDDAMAIFFALQSPELELIGLTTIFGNVHTDLATTNALRLLEIAGRSDIPVAKGADDPIAVPYGGPVPFVHGDDGQGNQDLPAPTTQAIAQTAAQFIIEQVMAAPGEITLIPIGPLTNLAMAMRLEPRIIGKVQEIILMGGNALGPGNATPSAEANIHNDPEAADLVFTAGWPVTMVGLDVTHKVHMQPQDLAVFGQIDTPMAQHMARILPFYRDFFEKSFSEQGIEGIYIHDSSAVAYAIDPTLFQVGNWATRVDTTQGISRGKTWPMVAGDFVLPPWQDQPPVTICIDVDGPRVVKLILDRMRG